MTRVEVCIRGHVMTSANIYSPPSKPDRHECLTCKRMRKTENRSVPCRYCERTFTPHTPQARYCSARCALRDRLPRIREVVMVVPTWYDRALCHGKAPLFDLYIDNESSDDRNRRLKAARKICAVCPVATKCRDEGLDTQSTGVWGGAVLYPVRRGEGS